MGKLEVEENGREEVLTTNADLAKKMHKGCCFTSDLYKSCKVAILFLLHQINKVMAELENRTEKFGDETEQENPIFSKIFGWRRVLTCAS